jgi:hypothetical protein
MVSSYTNITKRIENLLFHDLKYHSLICSVNDKLSYVKNLEKDNHNIVAIFEDGPHHIERYI